jgi:hypothetical protein
VGEVSEQVQRVAIAAFADHRRQPKPRPDLKDNKDPDRPLLASDDRLDLIGLKFREGEFSYFLIIEPATPAGCSFQPTMHRIPGDSQGSGNGGFIEAFDSESRNLIKGGSPMLESKISCPTGRAKRLPTSLALVAAALSPLSYLETVANDGSSLGLSRGRAVSVWTDETFHGGWTVSGPELMPSN